MVRNKPTSFRMLIFWSFLALVFIYTLVSIVISSQILAREIEGDIRDSSISQAEDNLQVFKLNMDNVESTYMNVLWHFFTEDFDQEQLILDDELVSDLEAISQSTNLLVRDLFFYHENSNSYYATSFGMLPDQVPYWLEAVSDKRTPYIRVNDGSKDVIGYHGTLYHRDGSEVHLFLELNIDQIENTVIRTPFVKGTKQLVLTEAKQVLIGDDIVDPQALFTKNGFKEAVEIDGSPHNIYSYTDYGLELTYVYLVPSRQIYSPVIKDFIITITIFLLVAVITAFISYFISKRLYQPLWSLEQYVNSYVAYDWSAEMDLKRSEDHKLPIEFQSLHESIYQLVNHINSKIKDVREISALKDNEQLKNITTAVNPHFQFNILNSIIWMLEDGEVDASIEVLSALGKHYRKTMDINKNIVSIGGELDAMMNYFHLYNLTIEKKVSITINCHEALLKLGIQTLMLQPIIENAIIHGFAKEDDDKRIDISVKALYEDVCIEIEDNGIGIDREKLKQLKEGLNRKNDVTTSYGLWNVHKRCHLLYGPSYGIQINSKKGVYTKISLLIRGDEIHEPTI